MELLRGMNMYVKGFLRIILKLNSCTWQEHVQISRKNRLISDETHFMASLSRQNCFFAKMSYSIANWLNIQNESREKKNHHNADDVCSHHRFSLF